MKSKLFIFSFLLWSVVLADDSMTNCKDGLHSLACLEHIDVDIDHGILVLTCTYDKYKWVEITPSSELYVNGEQITLTRAQKNMVSDYYDRFMDIINQAKQIGIESTRIGLKGVKVGLVAVEGLLKVALDEYDKESFQEEIEEESEQLDDRAEELEDLADELEESAEELEELHHQLKTEIVELNQQVWF
jgi:hypothetical protein